MKAMRQALSSLRMFKRPREDTADPGDPAGQQHQQDGGQADQHAADRSRYEE